MRPRWTAGEELRYLGTVTIPDTTYYSSHMLGAFLPRTLDFEGLDSHGRDDMGEASQVFRLDDTTHSHDRTGLQGDEGCYLVFWL